MEGKDVVYLETREARRALLADFRQYDPQIMLFAEILPLITEGRARLRREKGKDGAWLQRSGRKNLRWETGEKLVETVCHALQTADLSIEQLAVICGRVFRAKATVVPAPDAGRRIIRIETGMERFSCRHCGMCCRTLDYSREVTAEDVARWQADNRQDILKWVATTPAPGNETRYRIWIVPGTNRRAAVCPFLGKEDATSHRICNIQEVKPSVCRQFPFSRKHGLMTGCRGFQ